MRNRGKKFFGLSIGGGRRATVGENPHSGLSFAQNHRAKPCNKLNIFEPIVFTSWQEICVFDHRHCLSIPWIFGPDGIFTRFSGESGGPQDCVLCE